MKLLGQILLICVLLSVIKALVVLIAVGIVLLIIWGLLYRTPETVGLIAFSLLIEALQVHPIVTIGMITLLGCVVLLARTKLGTPASAKPANIALLTYDGGAADAAE